MFAPGSVHWLVMHVCSGSEQFWSETLHPTGYSPTPVQLVWHATPVAMSAPEHVPVPKPPPVAQQTYDGLPCEAQLSVDEHVMGTSFVAPHALMSETHVYGVAVFIECQQQICVCALHPSDGPQWILESGGPT